MDPGPGRRYRPLNRTPPEYQTVIKFLLMASIMDSVWVSGPPPTASPCGIVGPGDALGVSEAALLEDVRVTLRPLNVSPKGFLRDSNDVGRDAVSTSVGRMLGALLLNTFVVGPNCWASLFGGVPDRPTACPQPRWQHEGVAGRVAGVPVVGAGWMETVPRRRSTAGDNETSICISEGGFEAWRTASDANEARRPAVVDPERPSPRRTSSELHGYDYESMVVPWLVQLFYVVTVVAVVANLPCCPAVLENACAFLL